MASGKNNPSDSGGRVFSALRIRWQRAPVAVPVLLGFFLITLQMAGCSTTARAPVINRGAGESRQATVSSHGQARDHRDQSRSGYHRVHKGDTLYSIAWRYGLDYRSLARWNGISEPYVIYPGQKLRLSPAAGRRSSASRKNTPAASSPRRSASSGNGTSGSSGSAGAGGSIEWQWPTRGKLVQLDTPIAKKGVDISGRRGQSVKAAAPGRVVYSGSGLLGYGKLIIIKHNDVYLSAYAHNDKIYVKEGDRVSVGQEIATMGLGNNGKPVLHFEIRKDGKPVSPLHHLPKIRS